MKQLFQLAFFILLALLPAQLGKHFWPDSTLVLGRRIDYLSPTVYLTDILLLGAFLIGFFKGYIQRLSQTWLSVFLALLLFLSCNIFIAQEKQLTLLYALRLVEMFLLVVLIKMRAPTAWNVALPLLIGVVYTVVLALAQFLSQSSVGGMWYFLGERSFSSLTPGISQMSLGGQLFLRPYATFSHPNALGGFLLLLLPFFLFLETNSSKAYVLRQLGLAFLALGIFLSFSRVAWLGGLGVFVWWMLRQRRHFLFWFVGGAILGISLFSERFLSLTTVEQSSVHERIRLTEISLRLFSTTPLLGIGFNNFILALPKVMSPPYLLQPVHSVPLLLLTEAGVIGLFLFLVGFICVFIKTKHTYIKATLICFLFLGLFDHYFMTLPQTRLLLGLILGLAFL